MLETVTITVFEVTATKFAALGEINRFTHLLWPDNYAGYGTFELQAPVTDENQELLREGNYLWTGGKNAAIIEIVNSETDTKGQKNYVIKGRTLETLILSRIIWGTYSASSKYVSTIMYDLVKQNCVSPSDAKRKIPYLKCGTDLQLGGKIAHQKTGGYVYDDILDLATEFELGFDVQFLPETKELIFVVSQGVDRTNLVPSGNGPLPVLLSTDLEDILASEYYLNTQDERNLAWVQGEGEGSSRKEVVTGADTNISGFARKELYVDARDVQSSVYNDDGTTTVLTEAEYLATLTSRGNAKLAEYPKTETFEATIRTTGGQYIYGEDYSKGDKIVIQDQDLGLQVIGRITEVVDHWGESHEIDLTFGYSSPTLLKKITRNQTG